MFKLDRKTLESIYFSFIRPTLEYADIVWDNCYTIEKYKLEQIQFEAAMIVTGATRSCSRTKLMEESNKILDGLALKKDDTIIDYLLFTKC